MQRDFESSLLSRFRDCKKYRNLYYYGHRTVKRGMLPVMVKLERQSSGHEIDDSDVSSLNFKIPSDLKKEFKGFAVARGMTMTELLIEGFELSKERRRS